MSKQIDNSVSRKPRVSPRQLAANRANARRSTGPRSPEGKERSACNALKHGILAMRAVNPVMDGEDQFERFQAHRDAYFDALQPADQVQADLVEQIASNRWRMAKLLEFEHIEGWRGWCRMQARFKANRSYSYRTQDEDEYEMLHELGLGGPTIPPEEHTARITRYRGSLNSEYFRAMAELRRLKKDLAANDGLYSVSGEEEAPESVANVGQGDDGINSVLTTEGGEIEQENGIYQTNPNAESSPDKLEFSHGGESCADYSDGAGEGGGPSDPGSGGTSG